jgi:hypothetical protein
MDHVYHTDNVMNKLYDKPLNEAFGHPSLRDIATGEPQHLATHSGTYFSTRTQVAHFVKWQFYLPPIFGAHLPRINVIVIIISFSVFQADVFQENSYAIFQSRLSYPGYIHALIQCGTYLQEIKRPECEADHLPSSLCSHRMVLRPQGHSAQPSDCS